MAILRINYGHQYVSCDKINRIHNSTGTCVAIIQGSLLCICTLCTCSHDHVTHTYSVPDTHAYSATCNEIACEYISGFKNEFLLETL